MLLMVNNDAANNEHDNTLSPSHFLKRSGSSQAKWDEIFNTGCGNKTLRVHTVDVVQLLHTHTHTFMHISVLHYSAPMVNRFSFTFVKVIFTTGTVPFYGPDGFRINK